MCTYNISIDDQVVMQMQPLFSDGDTLRDWIQEQVSQLASQFISANAKKDKRAGLIFPQLPKEFKTSDEIYNMGINFPADFDYVVVKDEMYNSFAK